MHGVPAGKAPADFVVACALAFALGFLGGSGLVLRYGAFLFGGGEHFHQFMFRRQDHEAHPVDGVRSGREHLDGVLRQALDAKVHRRAFAAANPIALGFLDAVRPIEAIQVVDQALGEGRNAHDPLAHPLADHGVTAALAQAVFDFVIGQNRTEGGAPIDLAVGEVGQPELHQNVRLRDGIACIPMSGSEGSVKGVIPWVCSIGQHFPPVPIARRLCRFKPVALEHFHQRRDGFGAVGGCIVPRFEQLGENPLGPPVVSRVTGAHFARPIVAESELVQLFPVTPYVGFGRYSRMLSGLDGILFGGKSEAVVAHRMQDVEPLVALVAGEDVARDVAERVPDVQASTRRVREHVQDIEFILRRVFCDLVGF